jgi:hypothetical protein
MRHGSRGTTITVYPGDTLDSLAFAYGCSPEDLQRCNPGQRLGTRRLPVGVQLRLPKDGAPAPWNRLDARLYGGREEQQPSSSGLPLLPVAVGFAVAVGVGAAHISPDFNKRCLHVAKGTVKVVAELAHNSRRLAVQFGGHVAAFFRRVVVVSEMKASHHAVAPVTSASALRAELARAKAETAAAKAIAAAAEHRADMLTKELDTALAQVEELTHAEQTQRELAEAVQARVHELAKQLTRVRHAAGDEDET